MNRVKQSVWWVFVIACLGFMLLAVPTTPLPSQELKQGPKFRASMRELEKLPGMAAEIRDAGLRDKIKSTAGGSTDSLKKIDAAFSRLPSETQKHLATAMADFDALARETDFKDRKQAERFAQVSDAWARSLDALAGDLADTTNKGNGSISVNVSTFKKKEEAEVLHHGHTVCFMPNGYWVAFRDNEEKLEDLTERFTRPSSPTESKDFIIGDYRMWTEKDNKKTVAQMVEIRPKSRVDRTMDVEFFLKESGS